MLIRNLMSSTALFNYPRAAAGEGDGAGGDPPAIPVASEGDGAASDLPAGETTPAAADLPVVQDPPVTSARDWRDREIAAKHRQNLELKRVSDERQRRLDEIERENVDLRAIAERRGAAYTEDDETPPALPARRAAPATADPDAVKAEASRMVAKDNYDRDCNAAFKKGKDTYGDKWDESVNRLATLGGPEGAIDIDTMVGLLATDDPARVLYELGANPDEYHRVMGLPPAKRLNEMAKIASAPAPKKTVSNAPAPIEPVSGRGGAVNDELDDKLPDEQWYERRTAQKRKKWLESQGIRA